jgi:hypothetical protein
MTAHVIPDLKDQLKMYASKIVEYSWDVSIGLTFVFTAMILFMLIYGLAINYKVISPPPLLCHDMIGDPQMKDICK